MGYKISIIVPIFNVEKYIRKALDSILKQTIGLENLEVIMVNDSSTDKSGDIINEYDKEYENFVAVHLPKNSGGAGKPRNVGIENSSGKYLMFLDPDDFYAKDICETLYNKITTENVDVVFSNFYYNINGITQKNGLYFENFNEMKLKSIDDYPKLLITHPSLWSKIYARSFIIENDIKFPEDLFSEDRIFVLKTFLEANGIIYLQNYFGINYRIHELKNKESISNSVDKLKLMKRIKGYAQIFNILKEYEKEEYFPFILANIREFWTDGFVLTDAKISEKRELLQNANFLFEEFKKYNVTVNPTKKYLIPLFNQINNKNYDEAILISEVLKDFIIKEQKLREEQEYLSDTIEQLSLDNNHLKSSNIDLHQQLDVKKKELADYLTIAGYVKYKSENIVTRMKNRIKFQIS